MTKILNLQKLEAKVEKQTRGSWLSNCCGGQN